tara:strand:+ start:264 stop:509 length:246 start_codon:yes stop_codon:yes gene_type:complete
MPCSICGIIGHNKLTCGKYNNTMPKSSSFYNDYKQIVSHNYNYAKIQKQKSGKSGAVLKKTKNPYKNITFAKNNSSSTSYL